METEKTVNEIDESAGEKQQQKSAREQKLREVEERELGLNRDYDSLYALAQKSQISGMQKNTEVKAYEH